MNGHAVVIPSYVGAARPWKYHMVTVVDINHLTYRPARPIICSEKMQARSHGRSCRPICNKIWQYEGVYARAPSLQAGELQTACYGSPTCTHTYAASRPACRQVSAWRAFTCSTHNISLIHDKSRSHLTINIVYEDRSNSKRKQSANDLWLQQLSAIMHYVFLFILFLISIVDLSYRNERKEKVTDKGFFFCFYSFIFQWCVMSLVPNNWWELAMNMNASRRNVFLVKWYSNWSTKR